MVTHTVRTRPLWIARVGFMDGHRWHNFTFDKFEAPSMWTAARLAIQGAKQKLTKGTRIEEVSVHLTRLKVTSSATTAGSVQGGDGCR